MNNRITSRSFLLRCGLALLLSACAQPPLKPSATHVTGPVAGAADKDIPQPLTDLPYVPPAEAPDQVELYTVVVNRIEVREVLFALARDAAINLDIHDGIAGTVTLNAIDQSLQQILERIALQVPLFFELRDGTLQVQPDQPVLRTYPVNYLNMERNATGTVGVSSQVATAGNTASGGGGGNNNSTTTLTNTTLNNFWTQLTNDINGIIGGGEAATGNVLVNSVGGLVTVRATRKQHEFIQQYLDKLMRHSLQQVLIEATIVEVQLSQDYQTGVDWSILGNQGFGFEQSLTGANLSAPPLSVLTYTNTISDLGDINLAVSALETFGDVKVLSSPKLTVMNNQTAMLKVVDDRVYFTVEVEPAVISSTGTVTSPATFETEIHTIPVGLVMSVTPQIGADDLVSLNVRPSISRIVDFVQDPNPELRGNLLSGQSAITNLIPEVQVREIESLLQVNSGQVIVLGGLMQDSIENEREGLPWLSRLPLLGDAFSFRSNKSGKTELLIFLKPIIATRHSLSSGDAFSGYRQFLPQAPVPQTEIPQGSAPQNPVAEASP